MQNAASAAPEDPFTCRASALRVDPDGPLNPLPVVEPVVANDANNPCAADDAGIVNDAALPGGLGTASVLFAQTANDAGSQAQAGVADVTITVPGAPVIRAEVLTSQANAGACTGDGTPPELTSSSTVARVTVGDEVIEPVEGPQTIPLGPAGNLFLNQQTLSAEDGATENNTVTQRALFLDTPLADVVVAESVADFRGNPCEGDVIVDPPAQCDDGLDNDGDGKIDFPDDPGCESKEDDDETDGGTTPPPGDGPPQCSDELDNDGDGFIDFPNDPGCESPQDDNETDGPPAPECSDGDDNDGDGRTDYPSDPGCENRDDDDEENNDAPECSDGIDNDADGAVDFPADSGCKSATDDDEAAGFINGGGGYDEVDKKTGNEDFVEPGDSLRFGAVLPCDLEDNPGPNLVTTFLGDGNEAQFKLEELTRAFCRNDPFIDPRNPNAEFDTYVGEGTGTLRINGADVPATAEFILIDRGEPGSPPVTGVDFYQIEVRPFGLPIALAEGVGTLDEGNLQAHTPGRDGTTGPPADGGGKGGKGGGGGKGSALSLRR